MLFTEINGTDSFTINMIAMTSSSSTTLTFTLYENSSLNAQAVPNKPTYDELTTPITRNYVWDKNSEVTVRLKFTRSEKTLGGNKAVRMEGDIRLNGNWTGVYLGMVYPSPTFPYQGTLESNFTGYQIIGYDIENKNIASLIQPYATYVSGVNLPGESSPRFNNILITPQVLTKGTYRFENIYVGSQKITNSNQLVTAPIGSRISYGSTIGRSNEDLWNAIFNYTPLPSYPNQNPDGDNDNSGQSPSDPPIPGNGDTSSDPIPNPPAKPIFDVTNTGFVVIYNPSATEIRQLAYFMWSGEFVDLIKKMFASPFEAVISLKMLFCPITAGNSQTVWLGNVETDVTMAKVTDQFTDVDLGTINVNEFFGSFADYAPFTKIQIYLPFIGFKDLNVDEVMNSQLHLRYRVDVYTGACIAYLTVTKTIKSTNLNSILYQFDGNCAMEIPFTSNDNSRYVAAIMNSVASSALSLANTSGYTMPVAGKGFNQKAIPSTFELGSLAPVANGMLDIMSAKPNVQRAGSLSGAVSAMALKQPYLIIHRPIAQMPADYQKYLGIPLNLTRQLANVTGYTIVSQVFMSSELATDREIAMITEALKNGVIL